MNKTKTQKYQDSNKVKWDAKGPLQLTPQELFIGATDEHALVMVGRILGLIDAIEAKDHATAKKIASRGGMAFDTFKKFARAAVREAFDINNVPATIWILKEHVKEFFRTSPEGREAAEKYNQKARERFYQESRPLKDYNPAKELPLGHTPEQREKRKEWERENDPTIDFVPYSHKGNKLILGPEDNQRPQDRIEIIFKPADKSQIVNRFRVMIGANILDSEGNHIIKLHGSSFVSDGRIKDYGKRDKKETNQTDKTE